MPSLQDLLSQNEEPQLEFKRTLSSAYRIARTLAAFANTAGGTLLVGVNDDKQVVGVMSEAAEVACIEEAAGFLIDPPVAVSYETLRHESRTVLLINVPESDEKPHAVIDAQGHRTFYVRQRDKSVPTLHVRPSMASTDLKLQQSSMGKQLLTYLRQQGTVTAAQFAKRVNVSDKRAARFLHDLVRQGVLLEVDTPRPARFSLRV
jgi:predicted HTH transcriptional regulator